MASIGPKCILHAGMPKTGTTSIQQYLYDSADSSDQFVYVSQYEKHSGFDLTHLLNSQPTDYLEYTRGNLKKNDLEKFINASHQYVKKLAEKALDENKQLIFSWEGAFIYFNRSELTVFRDMMESYGFTVEVIISIVREVFPETVQNSVSGEKFITFTKNTHESMKGKKKEDFDYQNFEQQAIKAMYEGKSLEQALGPLLKRLVEASLQGEMQSHLESEKASGVQNRRNGKTGKTVRSRFGPLEVETPRDRSGTYEPVLIPKHERRLGNSVEQKILSLYSMGMSYRQIQSHLQELYSVELSEAQLTNITDKILPVVEEWRNRPLESLYAIVWLDAIHYKVRHEGRVVNRAIYCIIGVNMEGKKDVLGLYVSENEGSKFWLQVMTQLQQRGVQDILITCIDNLKGFAEAVETIFPQTEVQLCVVHQIRNSLKYVGSKHQKEFMRDLKQVYQAPDESLARVKLEALKEKWGKLYPVVVESWENNWDRLTRYFQYPAAIRRIIYTTNTVEGFHRQLRKVTKTKSAFTSDNALMKLLFLAIENITEKWTSPLQNWSLTFSQLDIYFRDRIRIHLRP
jgi:transposase-like protein